MKGVPGRRNHRCGCYHGTYASIQSSGSDLRGRGASRRGLRRVAARSAAGRYPVGSAAIPRVLGPAGRSVSLRAGQVLAQIRVGSYPDGIIAAFGSLWTANLNAGSVSRIDPATRLVAATIRVPPGPISLLAAGGAIWAAGYNGATVSRIDPATNRVTATARVGAKPVSLALAGSELWVFNQGDQTVSVLDPRTTKVIRTIRTGVAAGFTASYHGLLWVPDFQGGSRHVLALSPATGGAVRTIDVGSMPVQVGFGQASGWTGNGPDDTVTRFDPVTARCSTRSRRRPTRAGCWSRGPRCGSRVISATSWCESAPRRTH